MKICIIGRKYPPAMGGIATYYYNLASYYAEQGHEVIVITQKRKKHLGQKGVKQIFVDCMDLPFIRGMDFSRKAAKIIYGMKDVDIVLSNIPQIPDLFYKNRKGKPYLVHTAQTTFKYEKECIKDQKFWKMNTIEKGYMIINPLLRYAEKICLKKSDLLIACSQALKNELKEMRVNEEKIRVVYNGVSTETFKPVKKDTSLLKKYGITDEKVFVYVGRFVKRKGIFYLLDALKRLKSEYKNFKLLVVGVGETKELKEVVQKYNLEDNVIFTGFVNREDLPKVHSIANIFLIPSLYEGFPFTMLEAMACGKATIGTDIGGINEIIRSNENGLLIKSKNSNQILAGIKMLLDNPKLLKKLEKRARKEIEEKYAIQIVGEQNLKLYDELLNGVNKK